MVSEQLPVFLRCDIVLEALEIHISVLNAIPGLFQLAYFLN